MNIFKKLLTTVVASTAFVASAQASEINIGGVVFDPDYNVVVEQDFLALFNFTQWYASSASTVGTVDNYNSAVNISTVLGSLGGTGATGYILQGAGKLYQVNDSTKNFTNGFGGINSFCPGCQLTYAFGGIGLNKDNTFDVSNAWAKMFVDTTTDVNTPITSQTVANKATDGNVWLDFSFQNLAFQSGTVSNGLVSATLNIIGGIAANNFDPQSLFYSASAFFPFVPNPLSTPTNPLPPLVDSKYSSGGNGQAFGNTIPEPGTIAILGLGLLGLALSRRRSSAV